MSVFVGPKMVILATFQSLLSLYSPFGVISRIASALIPIYSTWNRDFLYGTLLNDSAGWAKSTAFFFSGKK